MKKFYKKNEVWFAVCWIILYCVILTPIRRNFGDDSLQGLAALLIIGAALVIFIKNNHLGEKYGLSKWPQNWKIYLYFIPMWLLSTGNLWGGIKANYSGPNMVYALISMALVGFIEEVIFRGFLFKAMLKENGEKPAIIVSSVTFGIGHIVNLLSGQASLETIIQIVFAIVWGFMFTFAFYKSGSLLPCIAAHSLIDICSIFAADNPLASRIYVISTIIVGTLYCLYLSRLPERNA